MQKITAFKLSNGNIVEDIDDAKELQSRIDFEADVERFAEIHGSYAEGRQNIFDAINENSIELYNILHKYHGK